MLWFISPEKTLMGENNFKVLFLSIIISIFQTLFFLYLTRMWTTLDVIMNHDSFSASSVLVLLWLM